MVGIAARLELMVSTGAFRGGNLSRPGIPVNTIRPDMVGIARSS